MQGLRTKIKNIVYISTSIFSSIVFANHDILSKFRFGIDGQWASYKWEKEYGEKIFKKQIPSGNIYLGYDINDYLGLELGYEVSPVKKRIVSLYDGTYLGSNFLNPPLGIQSFVQSKGYHFDIKAKYCVDQINSSIFLKVGILNSRVTHETRTIEDDLGAASIVATHKVFKARKLIFKNSFGIEHNVNNSLGFRAGISWYNNRRFKNIYETRGLGNGRFVQMRNNFGYFLGVYALNF